LQSNKKIYGFFNRANYSARNNLRTFFQKFPRFFEIIRNFVSVFDVYNLVLLSTAVVVCYRRAGFKYQILAKNLSLPVKASDVKSSLRHRPRSQKCGLGLMTTGLGLSLTDCTAWVSAL